MGRWVLVNWCDGEDAAGAHPTEGGGGFSYTRLASLLATLERRIPETHLPVAELEREEHQTRTALRAVREARATDFRALTLIAALEEQRE